MLKTCLNLLMVALPLKWLYDYTTGSTLHLWIMGEVCLWCQPCWRRAYHMTNRIDYDGVLLSKGRLHPGYYMPFLWLHIFGLHIFGCLLDRSSGVSLLYIKQFVWNVWLPAVCCTHRPIRCCESVCALWICMCIVVLVNVWLEVLFCSWHITNCYMSIWVLTKFN